MSFVIVPDTGCDLSKDLREQLGIEDYVRGIIYFSEDKEEFSSLDWEKMTPEEYYSSMRNLKNPYKTASTPMGEYVRVWTKYLEQGIDVLSISISSGLSTTFNEACIVARDLMEKYPGRIIRCVDSMRYSTSLALLVKLACDKRNSGATLEETVEFIEKSKGSIHQMGFMDDLNFLCKTGRISNFKAVMGSIVSVTPLADFNSRGMAEVIGKAKGRPAALRATIEYIKKTIINPEEQTIFVAHSLRKEWAEKLATSIEETFHPKEVILNDVGMTCGANIGPGLCCAFYMGNPISETMEEEKAILAKCIEETRQ